MKILAPTNTFQPTLERRPEGVVAPRYRLNESVVQILKLINDFKLLQNMHIARFVSGREKDANLARKLRTLWLDGMVERFKVYSGSIAEMKYYYILSKKGADFLRELGKYEDTRIQSKKFSKGKEINWNLFGHDSWVADLASFESLLRSDELEIDFLGELACVEYEEVAGKVKEALSPDYLTIFTHRGDEYHVYTEFERTHKSHEKKLRKLNAYANFFGKHGLTDTIRFVFLNEKMEFNFWASLMKKNPAVLVGLNIYSTNLERIQEVEDLKEPVYIRVNESNMPLERVGAVRRVSRDKYNPVKLFEWM